MADPKNEAENVGQDSFLNVPGTPVLRDETDNMKADGMCVKKRRPAQRTREEVQSRFVQPIVERITTTNASVWTDT